jgi:hypothetical protein
MSFSISLSSSGPNRMRIRTGNYTAIRTPNRIAFKRYIIIYRTENRIPIRFATNRSPICTGNRKRVDGP